MPEIKHYIREKLCYGIQNNEGLHWSGIVFADKEVYQGKFNQNSRKKLNLD